MEGRSQMLLSEKTSLDIDHPIMSEMIEDSLLYEREKTHGSFFWTAFQAQEAKDQLRKSPGWQRLSPSQKESMDAIEVKKARILSGDPNTIEHWKDIAGYATLVVRHLEREETRFSGE